MDWNQAKDVIMCGAAGLLCTLGWRLLDSIQELNIKVAVVIEKLQGHEERLKSLEEGRRS